MPPLPTPGSVLRVTIEAGDAGDVEAGSRFFLKYTSGAPSSADLTTLAGDISAAWGTHIASLVSTAESLHGVTIVDLSSDVGNEGIWTGTVAGTRSGGFIPSSACAVVNHTIARRYRGGRPRTYLRCGTQTDLNGSNQWETTFTTAVLTGWQAFVAEVLAATAGSIVLADIINISFYKGFTVFTTPSGRARNIPTPRETPLLDSIVNSTVAIKVGSQRRRLNL
jgi:hypothetical protein